MSSHGINVVKRQGRPNSEKGHVLIVSSRTLNFKSNIVGFGNLLKVNIERVT